MDRTPALSPFSGKRTIHGQPDSSSSVETAPDHASFFSLCSRVAPLGQNFVIVKTTQSTRDDDVNDTLRSQFEDIC
jgi:hypothetical protein